MALTPRGLMARFREALGVVFRDASRSQAKETEARAAESLNPQVFSLVAGDSEDAKFRRITSPQTQRDLNPLMHERMQQVCYFLAVTTPFGRRIVQVITDYIVGEGFSAEADDSEVVQPVLDRFWKDSVNKMDENCESFTKELLTFGEICLPVAVNPVDGFVRLGYIDPQDIESVEYALLQTANSQEVSTPVAVRLRRRVGEAEARRLEIIRADEDPYSPTFGRLKGDCFYRPINKAKGASRGISELFALADWIDVFDRMVFDFADRVRLMNAYVWQFVFKGADEKTVEEKKAQILKNPPRQGSYIFGNENMEVKPIAPELKGADMSEASRVVKLYGMGGAGLPAWFFADPVDANRATAQEMQGPTGKMLTNRQNVIKQFVTEIITFVIDQAVSHGTLPASADLGWKLRVPDLSVKDMKAASDTLTGVTTSCALAEDRGWIQSKTAAQAVLTVLTQLGLEVDADEFEQAQANKIARDATNQNNLGPQSALADALKSAGKEPAKVQ